MVQLSTITTDSFKERMVGCLCERVGLKRKWTVEAFAEMCGIKERSIESYKGGVALPPLPKFWRILYFLGPRTVNSFLRMIGMDGARRVAVELVTDPQLSRAVSEIQALFARIYEDGKKDHREAIELFRTVAVQFETIQDWLTQNDPLVQNSDVVASSEFLEMRNSDGLFDA